MHSCSSQILLLVRDVIHVTYTQINIEEGTITIFAKWWTKSKTTSLKVVNNDANPSRFISTFVKKKKITTIILTLQKAKTEHNDSCVEKRSMGKERLKAFHPH
jgi:hypothetical protein